MGKKAVSAVSLSGYALNFKWAIDYHKLYDLGLDLKSVGRVHSELITNKTASLFALAKRGKAIQNIYIPHASKIEPHFALSMVVSLEEFNWKEKEAAN